MSLPRSWDDSKNTDALQREDIKILHERLLQGNFSSLPIQRLSHLYVIVWFFSCRREVNVNALDERSDGASEESLHRALDRGTLHLLFDVVAKDAVQLLHIL